MRLLKSHRADLCGHADADRLRGHWHKQHQLQHTYLPASRLNCLGREAKRHNYLQRSSRADFMGQGRRRYIQLRIPNAVSGKYEL
jgi:hypothetical protein